MMDRLLNDDFTDIKIVRVSSYGYAQADATKKSHKRKHPIGFAPPAKAKPRQRKV